MNKIKTKLLVPNKLDLRVDGNKAELSIYPFERGYGITLAHPIRRVLLASTVGYAPVAIKIDGVAHEFDSIKGVLEDVATFIINLKNIRFKIKDPAVDEIEVAWTFVGPKELFGSDLTNDLVEIVTPDDYIATLNEDVTLNFSLIIRKGMGFVASENIRDVVPADYIALDAFFSPIKSAVYNIENILVEDETDFEKIIFTIETDGQIAPDDALKDAVNKLFSQFAIFTEKFDVQQEIEFEEGLDEKYKIKNYTTKYLLKEVAKKFIPKEIVQRKDKRGFSAPINRWFGEFETKQYDRGFYKQLVFKRWKEMFGV